MIITLLSYKGGQSKSTTAIHLAGWLNQKAPTVVIDADPNCTALSWAERGSLPFRVVDEGGAAKAARECEHIIFDTPARPDAKRLKGYAQGADLLILVVAPDALSLDATVPAVNDLKALGAPFKVLLAMVRPNSHEGAAARAALEGLGLHLFKGSIRHYAAAKKAGLDGVLLRDVKDEHALDLWNDYGAIAKEILK